jgi:hypothetical protein
MRHSTMCLLTTGLLLAAALPLWGLTYTVDCAGGGDFATIQEAVDTAADGDTILVAPCVYYENVEVVGKPLTIEGQGPDVTVLETPGTGKAIEFIDLPHPYGGEPELKAYLREIKIVGQVSYSNAAVGSDRGTVVFDRCEVVGSVRIHPDVYGDVEAYYSTIEHMIVSGHLGNGSVLEDCTLGYVDVWGGYDGYGYSYALVTSSRNVIGVLGVTGGLCDSHDDDIDLVDVFAVMDCYSDLDVESAEISELRLDGGGEVRIASSAIDSVNVLTFMASDLMGYLQMDGCLVRGNVDVTGWGSYGFDLQLTHNTVLGRFGVDLQSGVGALLLSNILVGSINVPYIGTFEFWNNDFVTETVFPPGTYIDNIYEPPLFCDEPGENYTLEECSPCVGAAHDGGVIGAYGVGCECAIPVEPLSWGRLKSRFR